MEGLVQIQVVGERGQDRWFLIGLDRRGRVWRGTPRGSGDHETLEWRLMEETPPPRA